MSTLNSILCGYQPLSVGYSQNAADVRADRVVNNRCNSVTFGKEQYSSSDLVSLSWLQEGNILKITPIDNEEDPSRDDRFAIAHVTEGYRICDPGAAFTTTAGNRITIPVAGTGSAIGSPFVNAAYPSSYCQNLTKPCYSYTHLIFMAIESTPAKCMTVNQIYNWCETNFPFYKHAGAGWKNSLRHNLSINKSFKRLPRDGRAGNFESITSSKMTLFCDLAVIFDENDPDEGPGRGAYWAVEPRERPNLLDAIKRNPWNMGLPRERTVVRPISCNPIQSYATISTELPRVAIAPDSILRTSGSSNLLISNCHSGASSPYSFVETSELQVDPASNCQVSMPMTVSQTNPAAPLTHSYLPVSMNENDVADICEESQSNPNVFETWPAEEEEKYRSMVSLLVDGSSTSPDRLSEGTSGDVPIKPKKETKQRRKSSLIPTIENMCNECKENAASTCRSCSLRMWYQQNQEEGRDSGAKFSTINSQIDAARALANFTKLGPYASDAALDQLLEMLDAEQEVPLPPANRQKRAPPVSADGEVFITPAPYLDHEYSHCQTQLRKPDETRLVDAANARMKQERLNRLRSLADSALSRHGFRLGENLSPEEYHHEDYEQHAEDDNDDEHGGDDGVRVAKPCDMDDDPPETAELSPAFIRAPKRSKIAIRSRKRRVARSSGHLDKVPRRSSRHIRAPKRPYDADNYDHYNGGSFESLYYEEAEDSEELYKDVNREDPKKRIAPETDDALEEIDYSDPPPYTGHYQRRSSVAAATRRYNDDDGTEYSRPRTVAEDLLRKAERKKRRFTEAPKLYKDRSRIKRHVEDVAPTTSSEVLSTVHGNQGERKTDEGDNVDARDAALNAEQTSTAEAAKILLGISQMRNFRLQTGYLSMDSSQTSEDSLLPSTASS